MTKEVQRKLAAVFAADVVGYSRLMGLDEVGTRAALRDILDDIVTPSLDAHQGRLVKLMGDGVLAEFASVVDAVNCAVAMQTATEERAATLPEDKRIRFRIGVNIGDIIIEGDDIFGDGVNIAARLEGLADPGGVCVSRTVVDHVGDRSGIAFDDLGEIEVKNIAAKVHAYRVVPLGPKSTARPHRTTGWVTRGRLALGSLAALAIIAAVGGWWTLKPDFAPVDPAEMAAPLPNGPSIAVLPFEYRGTDPDKNDYLADGLSDNIISALTRLPDATVIAQSSTFALKGQAIDVRDVSKRFGVRYVLDGSVQLSGDTIRVTAQMVDGVEGKNVWTQTYDRPVAEIFDVQDEIALSVSRQFLGQAVTGYNDMTDGTESLEAWSEVVRGTAALDLNTPEALQMARKYFARAIELDPNYSSPYAGLSFLSFFAARFGATDDPAGALAIGVKLAEKAIDLDPKNSSGYSALAYNRMIQGDAERAKAAARKALEIHPSGGRAQADMAWMLIFSGEARAALPHIERAKRTRVISPYWLHAIHSYALADLGEFKAAIPFAEATVQTSPEPFKADMIAVLAGFHYLAGNESEARRLMADALALNPQISIDNFRNWDFPYIDKSIPESRYWGYRELGLPETSPAAN